MRNKIHAGIMAVVLVVSIILGSATYPAYAAGQNPSSWADGVLDSNAVQQKRAIWLDKSQSIDTRVKALLSVMTLPEKAAQMLQTEQKGDATPEIVKDSGIGSVFSGGGSAPSTGNSIKNWADRVNAYKKAALQSRLGIPIIYGVDGVHGNNNINDCVIFPHNIGLGATGDSNLVERIGGTAAKEIRAAGVQWTFAPVIGVPESERWGRYYECFGESASTVAKMGAAYIKGFQGEGSDLFGQDKVAATAKHYIGEGQTQNGTNQGNVVTDDFDQLMAAKGLLKPYQEAIEAGARIVMVSYNSVNGVKCHANKHLIQDILKGQKTDSNPLGLGFTGFVCSDYNGVDQLPDATFDQKVATSVNAGVDMFMETDNWRNIISAVINGCNNGSISDQRIDDAVSRILRVKFEMNLFEETVDSSEEQNLRAQVGSDAHRAVAEEAVEKSMTVLKNDKVGDKTALQLLESAKNIELAGSKANDIGAQCGGWTISWQGGMDSDSGAGKKVTKGTTILEGFQKAATAQSQNVTYNARGKLEGQDVGVVVVGESPYAETNGDRSASELKLSQDDLNVINTAVQTSGGKPLVLILLTGRPLALAGFIDRFNAVVEAWLPGTEGQGIANVMLNHSKDFTGTLPLTWTWYPQDIEKKSDPTKVLFPMGTGLQKDGTSIIPGGQTQIPANRPAAPSEDQSAITRSGGIDISAYNGKLEGEYCNPTSGDFSSYNINIGRESDNGNDIGYAEWIGKDWGNTKWISYIRQAGTYNVTARIKITKSSNKFSFGVGTAVTGDGTDGNKISLPDSTNGYEIIPIGQVTINETGLHGIKMMDSSQPPVALMKLDYLQFTLVPGSQIGAYDNSQDKDDSDNTPPQSQGSVIRKNAVEVYMTSTEKSKDKAWYRSPIPMTNQLSQKDSLDITQPDTQNLTTININSSKKYQSILGFGTSLEESTINNLCQLSPEKQDEFLRKLIDPKQGGMTLFRLTIGTPDFTSKPFYTYYDAKELTEANAIKDDKGELKPDWYNTTGHGFSIQNDIDYKIVDTIQRILRLAKEYGVEDQVKLFGSSWTPPGWMKTDTQNSLSYPNNELLQKGGKLSDDHIDDLAMYYTRYLEEYAKLGINIYALTLQNEPMLEINYPSCAISGEQEGKLAIALKKAIQNSTALDNEQKRTKIWAFDHNPSGAFDYVKQVLSVPGANDALDGVAFHDYDGNLSEMQRVLDTELNQGDKKDQTVNLTERSVWGTSGANSIITYLRNSAISYNSWVTMLDSNIQVHQWTGTPDPTLFARSAGSSDDYWAMPEYYILGQFARFIRPGDVRIDSNNGTSDTLTNVAFTNPETGKITVVVVNQSPQKQNFKVLYNNTQFCGAVPAKNVATYIWDPNAKSADKSGLQALYDANKNKVKGNYTDSSWKAFTDALTNAKSVLNSSSATQDEINSAKDALDLAVKALTASSGNVVDKSALLALYNANKDKTQGSYTASSWLAFVAALTNAQTVLKDSGATQDQVNSTLSRLDAAVKSLVAQSGESHHNSDDTGKGDQSSPTTAPVGITGSTVTTSSGQTFVTDTTTDVRVQGSYIAKITSQGREAPKIVLGTPGVFVVQLVTDNGTDYYVKLIATGQLGASTGVYLDGVKLFVATVETPAAASTVKSDTTRPFKIKLGQSYVLKLTANSLPILVSGTSGSFRIKLIGVSGKDYFFRIIPIGKEGASSGLYVNSEKTPVTIAIIA